MRPPDEHDLRVALQVEAARHQPDRAAILDRVERGQAHRRSVLRRSAAPALRRTRPFGHFRISGFIRPIVAAGGVAAVLVAAFAGIRVAGHPEHPASPVAAASAETAGSTTPDPALTPTAPASPSGLAGTSGTTSAATHHPATSTAPAESTTRPTTTPATTPPTVRDGDLSATATLDAGSISTWTQSDVTLTTTATVHTLVVQIQVARTDGVAKTGHWSSVPDDMVTAEVDTSAATLLYRFTLTGGASLAPGRYTFAAQFNHAAGARPLTGDTFQVTADTGKVGGGFTG